MKPIEANTDVKPGIGIEAWYKKTGNVVFVRSPCVFTEGKTLTIGEVYEIHDFTAPDVELIYVKLQGVYLKGFTFHIVGVDITNGDLKLFKQRLNANELPCSFLICDLLFLDENIVDKIIRTLGDEDLLDYDFDGKE